MTRLVTLPLVAALVLTISVPLTATGFETPEEAVQEYLEGVAQADIERVLEATAVDEMADGYRFDQYVERLNAFGPQMDGPVHSPFFADVQRADWTAGLLRQTRMLAYSLLAPEALREVLEGTTLFDVDEAWAADLVAELDEARLSNLVVAAIFVPDPEVYDSSRHLELRALNASLHGADEAAERVALFAFEGDMYAVGFTLLRYGDRWLVSLQSSALGGTDPFGIAMPLTVEE
jgi:hypothetical protein